MKATQLIFVLFFFQTLPLKAQTIKPASMYSLWDSLLSVPGKCQYSGYSKDTLRIVSKLVATVMQNNGLDTTPTVILPIGINIKFLDATNTIHPFMIAATRPYRELQYACLELESTLHRNFFYLSRSLDSILTKCSTDSLYKKNIARKLGIKSFESYGISYITCDFLYSKLHERYPYKYIGRTFYTQPAVTDIHLYPQIGVALVMADSCFRNWEEYYYDNKTQTWSVPSNERSWRLENLSKMENKAWTKWGKKRVAKIRAKEFEPIIFGGVE